MESLYIICSFAIWHLKRCTKCSFPPAGPCQRHRPGRRSKLRLRQQQRRSSPGARRRSLHQTRRWKSPWGKQQQVQHLLWFYYIRRLGHTHLLQTVYPVPLLLFLFFFFFFFFCIFFLWARGKQTDLLKHPSSLVCRCGFEGRTLCPAIQKSRTKKKKSLEKEALHHGGEEASEEEVTVCLSMSVAIKEACEMFYNM